MATSANVHNALFLSPQQILFSLESGIQDVFYTSSVLSSMK